MNSPRPVRLSVFLQVLCAVLLLAGLAFFVSPARLLAAAAALEGERLVIAALLAGGGVLLQWGKWQRLLLHHTRRVGRSEGLGMLVVGFALGLVSPGRLGELGRGLLHPGERLSLAGLTAADRLASLAATLLLAFVGLWVLLPDHRGQLAGGGLLLALLLGAGWRLAGGLAARLALLDRVRQTLSSLAAGRWIEVLVWSLLFNGLFMGQFGLLAGDALAERPALVWGIPLIFAIKALLPISFLDLGVREGAAVLVFAALGGDPATAFNAAFLLFALNVLLPGLGGWAYIGLHSVPALIRQGKRPKNPGDVRV